MMMTGRLTEDEDKNKSSDKNPSQINTMVRQLKRRLSLQPSTVPENREDRINTFLIASAAKRKEPINIVMLGPEKVGKTALICRYLKKDFPLKHKPTSEQTNHSTYTLAGVKLKLEILDTSGKNEFPAMRNLSLHRGDAFILVYDVTNSETFEEVRRIRDELHEIRKRVPIVVVANKIDLAQTEKKEMDIYTTESIVNVDWNDGFVQTSAKDCVNIDKVFDELLVQAKVIYKSNTASRAANRRQSLPPNQLDSEDDLPNSCPSSTAHVPTLNQLQRLHDIQARAQEKRNSCILS